MMKRTEGSAAPETKGQCSCLYCEEEIILSQQPFCKPCSVVITRCLKCGMVISDKKAAKCSGCGEPLG